ncbi:hypothetical protein SDC9_129748 [bioreactor metagenome]|uniref:Uncharacterized protein n=1 Tax=bioreactor metagenome TaxID=1076179 RepID=A0A645CZU8_9ZZZZ
MKRRFAAAMLQRYMKRQNIGFRRNFVQRTESLHAFGPRPRRIVEQHLHAQRAADRGHLPPDIAHPDHAEGFARQREAAADGEAQQGRGDVLGHA